MEYHHDKRSEDQTAAHAADTELPCVLSFPRPSVHAHHDEDNVGRRYKIEDLEGEVPECMESAWRIVFDVERHDKISGDEDDEVPYLCYERDTWQYQLRLVASSAVGLPSALLLEWIDQMRMHFETKWELLSYQHCLQRLQDFTDTSATTLNMFHSNAMIWDE